MPSTMVLLGLLVGLIIIIMGIAFPTSNSITSFNTTATRLTCTIIVVTNFL